MNKQNHDNQNQEKTQTGRTVFLRFFFVPASSSDGGGFAVWWVMAVRGVASHKPSSNKWQRALALDAGAKGFLGFGYKTNNHRVCRVRLIRVRNLLRLR